MPSIDTDTRLIMTILFVGSVSGLNVYFYTQYGVQFPYDGYAHGVLFGIITIGGIMIMKAAFDLILHDMIEDRLLQRNIDNYWNLLPGADLVVDGSLFCRLYSIKYQIYLIVIAKR